MLSRPALLDPVALVADLPEHGLRRGQVGTIVECHPDGAFEVEFVDEDGRTYALIAVKPEHVMVLVYRPMKAA